MTTKTHESVFDVNFMILIPDFKILEGKISKFVIYNIYKFVGSFLLAPPSPNCTNKNFIWL